MARGQGAGCLGRGGALLLLVPFLGGCWLGLVAAGAGASVGTVTYVQGEHSQVHAGSLERVWSATTTALRQLQIQIDRTTRDGLGGEIEAHRTDKVAVTVKVEPSGENATIVRIRIGTFGDQAESEVIQARIASLLQGGK
jgi:hypothetical protein